MNGWPRHADAASFLCKGYAMAVTMDIEPIFGRRPRMLSGRWGWFVTLGVVDLVLGGVASSNLVRANLASMLFVGAVILVSGLFQLAHAVSTRRLHSFLLWLLGSLVYTAAGGIILYDPFLASLELSLLVGAFLVVAGIARIWAGFHLQRAAGWRWVAAGGALTFSVGVIVIAAWPGIGAWLFGALLAADLIIQGWGHIALGMALRLQAARHSHDYAAA
jgi:uncharacterized membrane protein HdeD (DUF308 family)